MTYDEKAPEQEQPQPQEQPQQHLTAPVILDTRMLRPLPQELWGTACVSCDKTQSKWEMGRQGDPGCVFVCSLCFLYESQWGQRREEEITNLILDLEQELGEKFLRDTVGRLLFCKDADNTLGAIALTSRMFQVHDTIDTIRAAGGQTEEKAEEKSDG